MNSFKDNKSSLFEEKKQHLSSIGVLHTISSIRKDHFEQNFENQQQKSEQNQFQMNAFNNKYNVELFINFDSRLHHPKDHKTMQANVKLPLNLDNRD